MEPRYTIQNFTLRPAERRRFHAGAGYLMLLPVSGGCRLSLGGRDCLCTTTDLLLLKPGTTQLLSTQGLHEPCELAALYVAEAVLADFSDETCDLVEKYSFVPYKTALIHSEISTVLLLRNLLSRLGGIGREELQLGLTIYENSLLSAFVVIFLRACAQSDQVRRRRRGKELPMDEVFLFLRAHLAEDLSLRRLEKEFFVSGAHLSRTFRRTAGITLHAYITRSRIDLSKKYIQQGLPIQEVFGRCGFGSYNHFFKAFKKECGMTPRAYYHKMSDVIHAPQ